MEKLHLIHCFIASVTLLVNTSCIINAQDGPGNSIIESKELIAHQFEQWKNGKADFFDLLADDVIWEVNGRSSVSGIYKGKTDFIDRAVKPITQKLKTPLKPTLISLTADENYIWLHFEAVAITVNGKDYKNSYVWKMELKEGKITKCLAFLDTYELCVLMDEDKQRAIMEKTMEVSKEYLGMWVTKDGYIRHELLPGNRYDEARGKRQSAYRGSYKVTDNHIDYKDDTGFTADGEFIDGILYHAGMVLYKEE